MSLLTEERTKALQAEVVAACADVTRKLQELNLPPDDLIDFRRPVLDAVYSAFQQYARGQTARRSPIAKLPDDLLIDLFAHLGVWDRVRAAIVCHRWRDVSLGAPGRLWSTIPVVGDVHTWEALLDRARDAPVILKHIHITNDNLYTVLSALKMHMHHIKSLDFAPAARDSYDNSDSDNDSDNNWGNDSLADKWRFCLDLIYALPAPILENISVCNPWKFNNPLPLLGSPRLRSAKLHNFNLACLASCGSSSTLRVLVINVMADGRIPVQFWPLLSSFPALEVLAVLLEDILAELKDSPRLSISFAPTLRHLRLDIPDVIFRGLVDSLVHGIQSVPLVQFSFTYPVYPMPAEALSARPGPITCIALSRSSELVTFMITERSGHKRIFRHMQDMGTWVHALSKVEMLTCHFKSGFWTRRRIELIDVSITFAALQELTFDMSQLVPDDDYPYDEPNTSHMLCAFNWPYGPCPLLHTVRVRSYGLNVWIKLRGLVAVLSRLLDSTPQRRLSLLEVDNVNLVPDESAAGVSVLDRFTEHLTMRTDGDAWPECHLIWDTEWSALFD